MSCHVYYVILITFFMEQIGNIVYASNSVTSCGVYSTVVGYIAIMKHIVGLGYILNSVLPWKYVLWNHEQPLDLCNVNQKGHCQTTLGQSQQ